MLYPLVISPEFLITIKNDQQLLEKLKSFLIKYKEFWKDIFILIDDNNKNIQKQCNEIIKKYGHENPSLKIVIDQFHKLILDQKVAYIKINENNFSIDNILQFLKKKNVKKIVEFPKYFEDEFIDLKNTISKIYLKDINYELAFEKIFSITQFSKKICLIDPMIPYHLTNLNDAKKISLISGRQKDLNNFYVIAFNELIKKIYETNFFKDELEIYIYTTLNPGKLKHIKYGIKQSIGKISDEELKIEIDNWKNLDSYVLKCISECTSEIVSGLTPKIEIKQHYQKSWADLGPGETKQDVYERSIFAVDLDASLEVRKGLDIFDPKSKNKLRNISSYFLRMNISDCEKSSSASIFIHPKFKPEDIRVKFQ